MDTKVIETARELYQLRNQHPAWILLASRRAPIVASILSSLFEDASKEVRIADAEASLAKAFESFSFEEDFDPQGDFEILARKELRDWIKKKLIVERGGKINATASLIHAFEFLDSIQDKYMTSTASRLATVQREIDDLAAVLNPDIKDRQARIKKQIKKLQSDLKGLKSGDIKLLDEGQVVERIQDIYQLAMSLKSDFRRVEDSYRSADIEMRRSIIAEDHHRGEVVDKLLETQDALLATPEGRVFDTFYEQLSHTGELELMKVRLRQILGYPEAKKALTKEQFMDLRFLSNSLVIESRSVIEARARSESDVKTFIKAGMAVEHHRVNQTIKELFEVAAGINWSKQAIRRAPASLPAVGLGTSNSIPAVERMRFSQKDLSEQTPLDLQRNQSESSNLDADFWDDFYAFDSTSHVEQTVALIGAIAEPVSISWLYHTMRPEHPTEAIVGWIEMANQAHIDFTEKRESVEAKLSDVETIIYDVPLVCFAPKCFDSVELEI